MVIDYIDILSKQYRYQRDEDSRFKPSLYKRLLKWYQRESEVSNEADRII